LFLYFSVSLCFFGMNTPVALRIDARDERQTMDGFGAAGAWWAQDVGGWHAQREQVADLLFHREKGAGLSIYRYNIGAGNGENITDPWRRAATFEIAKGQYDWTRDANARWMLRAARDRGVEGVVAFANSPPARMTHSGLITGGHNGESNLRPDAYADFAQYLVDVARHLRDEEGVPVKWLSPINEPQWQWQSKNGQEGCHYTPAEVCEVARTLLRTVQNNKLDVQLSLFESGEWKASLPYVEALAGDPDVWVALPHLAIHSYWSTREDKQRFVAEMQQRKFDKPLWMAEWTEMKAGRDAGMDSALVMAGSMHDDLTIAGVTSWQYWIAVSKYDFRDGLIYVDPADRAITPAKRLWVMANYARFIRPGFVRLGVQGSNNDVLASAYRSPDGRRWVVVAINTTGHVLNVQFDAGDDRPLTCAGQFVTSEQEDLSTQHVDPSQRLWLLAPLSVTTFLCDARG
jgi:O-glycosyl hydrolase